MITMLPEFLMKAKIIVKITKPGDMTKAIVILDFGVFKIKGFRIRADKNGVVWVNPPSIPVGGKYRPVFFMEDRELWKELENKIIDEYKYQDIPIVEEQAKEENLL